MSKKREQYVTPKAEALWPRLNEPDTKFNPEGDYSVALVFERNDKDFKKLSATLKQARDARFAEWARENPKLARKAKPAPVFAKDVDEDGNDTGRILVRFKMRAGGTSKRTGKTFTMKPDIFDAQGVKLDEPPGIGNGSILKVAYSLGAGGYVPAAGKFYLSPQLNAVQIIELVEFGKRDAESYGFAAEEGYTATGRKADKRFADEAYDEDEDEESEDEDTDDADTGKDADEDEDCEEDDDEGDY